MLDALSILYYLEGRKVNASKLKWGIYCNSLHFSMYSHFGEKNVVDCYGKSFDLFCSEARACKRVGDTWYDPSGQHKFGLMEVETGRKGFGCIGLGLFEAMIKFISHLTKAIGEKAKALVGFVGRDVFYCGGFAMGISENYFTLNDILGTTSALC